MNMEHKLEQEQVIIWQNPVRGGNPVRGEPPLGGEPRGRGTDGQTDRGTERQRDRPTEGQRDRWTDPTEEVTRKSLEKSC